jgi:hypothetical protein
MSSKGVSSLSGLIDFDFIPDTGEQTEKPQVSLEPPELVVEIQTVMPPVPTSAIEVNDWRVIRDYVVEQITKYHGPFPRNPLQEKGIFASYISRWGDQALPIAKVAFEVHRGVWHNAPIKVQRFCIGSDPYFSEIIARTLM